MANNNIKYSQRTVCTNRAKQCFVCGMANDIGENLMEKGCVESGFSNSKQS